VTILARKELVPLQSYFSTREFGLIENLLFLPFVVGGQIVALLLIARAPALISIPAEAIRRIEESALIAAPLIRRSRTIIQSDGPAEPRGDLGSRLSKILADAAAEKRFILFVKLDVAQITAALPAHGGGLDPYRLRKDIVRVLSSMVSGSGELIRLAPNELLLTLTSRATHDERLVIHQICAGLGSLFGARLEPAELHCRSWTYPQETVSANELIADISR